ncbi:ATP-grasp domain-containing protein [Bacillus safensis]|uniref:ATP-grasp domain-containing protein n=1 Tax=Bacillus safensis TaxID=561879 RepID=UPI001BA6AA1E|nr:ATP-grasp domain-containing protein [Bacillus safensis]MBR0607491.1 ATP-grasp domain-containing protein [Bacillus safensis]WJE39813.1 ATP-grasp domain-containing protein [Bacillus safensis]
MKKVLLIVEAGRGREGAFQSLYDSGLFYIVFMSRKKDLYGYDSWIDEVVNVDTNDYSKVIDTVKDFQKNRKIDGIMTLLEWYVPLTEQLIGDFGFIGNSVETANLSRNKYLMRNVFKKCNVPIPKYKKCSSFYETNMAIEQIGGYPCIIKPIDNTGSTNVKLINNEKELKQAYQSIVQFDVNSRGQKLITDVLIEEFIDGPEFSVDSLTINGETTVLAVHDYITTQGPSYVEVGLSSPSMLSIESQNLLKKTAIQAIEAVGIKNGPSHCEIKLSKTGPKVMEIGARHGGGYIPELIKITTGVDFYVQSALLLCGEAVDFKVNKGLAAATRKIFSNQSGYIQEIQNLDKAKNMVGCEKVIVKYKKNDYISSEIEDYTSFIGYVITTGQKAEEAIKRAEKIRDTINIVVT